MYQKQYTTRCCQPKVSITPWLRNFHLRAWLLLCPQRERCLGTGLWEGHTCSGGNPQVWRLSAPRIRKDPARYLLHPHVIILQLSGPSPFSSHSSPSCFVGWSTDLSPVQTLTQVFSPCYLCCDLHLSCFSICIIHWRSLWSSLGNLPFSTPNQMLMNLQVANSA
jgi:hypothetical protein